MQSTQEVQQVQQLLGVNGLSKKTNGVSKGHKKGRK